MSSQTCNKYATKDCPPCSKLVQIQLKIDQTRHMLDQLLEEREAMVDAMNKQHDSLSHHLPPEIISNVFMHCLPFRPSLAVYDAERSLRVEGGHKSRHLSSLLTISQVCRQWRTITHGTPELWRVLPIDILSHVPSDVSVLESWLNRSGALPLFLRFRSNHHLDQQILGCIDKLIPHYHRLRVLVLDVANTVIASFFATACYYHSLLGPLDIP